MNKTTRIQSDWLPGDEVFGPVSEHFAKTLDALAGKIALKSGEVLFEQNDDGDAMFVILKGALEISVISEDGRKLSLDILRAGDVVGEIALFDGGLRTATATSHGASKLRRIRRNDLYRAISTDPKLAVEMIEVAGRRLRSVSTQLHEQVFLPMQTRLARRLLNLTADEAESQRILTMSQSTLADFVGASREAVSKTLAQWARDGVVEIGRGTVTICDRAALRSIAGLKFI